MSTTLYRSITHPPDTEDHQVLHIPVPERLRELAFADRLSFRVGLWLLERAQRPPRQRRSAAPASSGSPFEGRRPTPSETITLLSYDLQRQLR